MKTNIFEGRNFEEAKEKALQELNINENDLIIKLKSQKQGLLKKNVIIEVININDVTNYLKETIKEITSLMNIKVNLEIKRTNNVLAITIFSDNNSILIGKNGTTIQSLQNIIRQMLPTEVNEKYKIVLDVENYKEKKLENLKQTAKIIAKQVASTKVEAKLDAMNSYERREIHNLLSNNKKVYTESLGEEPNRYIIIKPKED